MFCRITQLFEDSVEFEGILETIPIIGDMVEVDEVHIGTVKKRELVLADNGDVSYYNIYVN